jgi:hypothetical protein
VGFIHGVLGDGWHFLEFGRAYLSGFLADFHISARSGKAALGDG